MSDQTYLIFEHRQARYGLPVGAVHRMLWLPALSPIEELPAYIAGVFNLRGRVLPVIDLCLRFGHASAPYDLDDRVIVINGAAGQVGIIANQLQQVLALAPAAITPASDYQGSGGAARFVFGQAQLDDGLVMLLDAAALINSAPAQDDDLALPTLSAQQLAHLYGELSPSALALLHSRTASLAQVPPDAVSAELQTYAVLRLDSELFALALAQVREFTHLRGCVPVPCCPAHIAGHMNLRGDILTLVDLRPVLGMARLEAPKEVVVVRLGTLRFGLAVTEIVDIASLGSADISDLPLAAQATGQAFCLGCASIGGVNMGILDLEKMLSERRLQVAEQVA